MSLSDDRLSMSILDVVSRRLTLALTAQALTILAVWIDSIHPFVHWGN